MNQADNPSPERPLAPERDLAIEAHVRAVALLIKIAGWAGVAASVVFAAVMFEIGGSADGLETAVRAMLFLGGAGALASALVLLLGRYLGRYAAASRWLTMIIFIAAVIGSVFQGFEAWSNPAPGTLGPRLWEALAALAQMVYAGSVLGLLIRGRTASIFTSEYRAMVTAMPGALPPTARSPFFWTPLAIVAYWGALLAAGVVDVSLH